MCVKGLRVVRASKTICAQIIKSEKVSQLCVNFKSVFLGVKQYKNLILIHFLLSSAEVKCNAPPDSIECQHDFIFA